jgi:hypothetical protein
LREVSVAQPRLRGEPVLVDQPAEQITPAETIKIDDLRHCALVAERRLTARRPLPEGAVRPVLVVVQHLCLHHVLEVAAAEDQQPIEALAADGAGRDRAEEHDGDRGDGKGLIRADAIAAILAPGRASPAAASPAAPAAAVSSGARPAAARSG